MLKLFSIFTQSADNQPLTDQRKEKENEENLWNQPNKWYEADAQKQLHQMLGYRLPLDAVVADFSKRYECDVPNVNFGSNSG